MNRYLALAIGVAILGFAPIIIRQAEASGTMTAFYRLAIGMLATAGPFFFHLFVHKPRIPRQGLGLAALGGFFFAMDMAFWSTGVVLSGATIPTLLANTSPIWVGIIVWLWFREQQSIRFWMGLLMAMVGMVLVMQADLSQSIEFGWGSGFGILAGMFYAGFHLVSQRGRKLVNTLVYFWIMTFSATVTLLIINLALNEPFTGYSLSTYGSFLMLGVLVHSVGWTLLNYVQGYLPAAIVAPSLLGQPVVTALFAGPLIGEELTVWHLVGGAVVLVGVYTVHRSRMS